MEQIHKLENRIKALDIAIQLMIAEYPMTTYELIEIRDEMKSTLKDLQFESSLNPLPFPEK